MTGHRFDRLVCLEYSHRGRGGHAHWSCICDCGNHLTVNGGNLRTGNTTSCGCRHKEISAARLSIHGYRSKNRHEPTYRAWQAMKTECYNPKTKIYGVVGACGIRVCTRWRANYACFLRDMGERPSNTKLKRIDLSKDYAQENCEWQAVSSREERALKSWMVRREKKQSFSNMANSEINGS